MTSKKEMYSYLINLSFKLKDQFFLDKNNADKLCLI